MIKGELTRKKIELERALATKIILLAMESVNDIEYQVICSEIKSVAHELLKLSLQFQEYQESLEDAQDESK